MPLEEIIFKAASSKIKATMRNLYAANLKERTKERDWSAAITKLPDYPRHRAIAAFRMTTKHDCLHAHLNRLKIVNSSACLLCSGNQEVTADLLPQCPDLREVLIYSRYCEDRELLF